MSAESAKSPRQAGAPVGEWMGVVLEQWEAASDGLLPDPVHDLRVALRRCLAIADGFLQLDPHPAWRAMHKEARRLFKRLGALRDTQVLAEWARKVAPAAGGAKEALLAQLERREAEEKQEAESALAGFNRRKWKLWAEVLPERTKHLPLNGPAVAYLALERWNEAYRLHRQALRNRTHPSFHRLRIGLKRFRYTVENFLPRHHREWSADLKALQDLLGEVHDLDLLRQTSAKLEEFSAPAVRAEWRERLEGLCAERFASYRAKMAGRKSLWMVWRNELLGAGPMEAAAIAWLEAWASFRTPDLGHSKHVAALALELYDRLAAENLGGTENGTARRVLHAAALAHDVGRMDGAKSHHKASYRMIASLGPLLGWTPEEMRLAALVARYHRRALPQLKHAAFARLSQRRQQKTLLLAGILRLANAFDQQHDRSVRHLEVEVNRDRILIRAEGYGGQEPLASRIAMARHLVEIACKRPVTVLPGAGQAMAVQEPRASHAA
jgi:CHAD domain-containing protein/HD superfamily phosphodiesterase